ncbi:2OG-Fe(II) oxygenase [Sphingomonas nostoxanthinifaciens]|uniref:2OG-Fe(II) oxygenase n=1 Tax=Sphingomonas nostoxanthinifaciens TaxID=2872652 RepID=UPI001CC20DEA|nr:2OG-Fe(II) oxygenase [Sphingomonas nostoxanthinifaciens]UAK23407.1 2OG-Fe(II) oxygenase [Sphingomonas nostoxanthinifaciens]
MTILDQAGRLFASGRAREGAALVEQAAARGDGEALFALANWRLYGLNGAQDLAATHRLLAQAAAAGHGEALRLRARLIGNGTGVSEDAAEARRLLAPLAATHPAVADELALADAPAPTPQAPQHLADTPRVERIDNFLSRAECDYLIARATPRLQPSTIVDPASRRRMPHPFRTSLGINFGPAHEDLVVRLIDRRIADATGTAIEAGEPLHVLAYAPGQEYRPHLDALPGAANQRVLTVLLWLGGDYDGGETDFPAPGVRVRGEPGDALIFSNVTAEGRADERSRHAGLPVTRGRKWLATRWIRQAPVSPFA